MHHLSIQTTHAPIFSDSRTHPPHGIALRYPAATRNVRLQRATPTGGAISPSEDGIRCVVAGAEYLRIIRVSDPDEPNPNIEHRSNVGLGGYRLDSSRNMWDATALKTDSSVTDVEWAHGQFNHKIVTSARNGELILWDLNKSGVSKYETKAKDHTRSVHKLSVSPNVHHYCITGSADGDLRAWDIREIHKSRMRIHHPTGIRGIAFSPSPSQPLQAIVGLENGSIYRWDLRMGQRGLLDRLLVAHTASVTSLDWYLPDSSETHASDGTSSLGWIVSSGLDRTVKVWDVSHAGTSATATTAASHIPQKATYTLHPSFPVRRVIWRPGYDCEVALVSNSNAEFGSGNLSEPSITNPTYASALTGRHATDPSANKMSRERGALGTGDAVEIWDVRRGWIAKWTVRGSAIEGGVTDIAFRDSHAIWATHASGMFSQIDLRDATKPIDAIPRVSISFEGGRIRVAQMWLLLGSALSAVSPEPPRPAPVPIPRPMPNYTFPPLAKAADRDSSGSPGRSSLKASPHDRSASGSRKLTPTSSNQSSPRFEVESLPPVTPRRPTLLSRRQSGDSGAGSRRSSHLRRPSMSTNLTSSSNPSPSSNTRHVGEGALDDSDTSSSESGASTGLDVGDEMTNDDVISSESERENEPATTVSPSVVPARVLSATRSHPSPLSKIAELNWSENETEEGHDETTSSPSPVSTDVDKSNNDGRPRSGRFKMHHRKSKSSGSIGSRRTSSTRLKSRSRSSTLASLAAPTVSRTLVHQSSHSSILTVTAGEMSHQETTSNGLKAEDTIRDLRNTTRVPPPPPSISHERSNDGELVGDSNLDDGSKLTERRGEFVRAEEARFQDATWDIIRELLESFADEGDIQTCAMLALVAPEELRLSRRRVLQFLDAYIDLLSRLQLHSCAAYIRKFCGREEIFKTTLIETQIHTSCGNCRKPLVISAGTPAAGQLVKGGFAFCIGCSSNCVTCAICRLPVRTLLFQCEICQHGGHQACYRRLLFQQTMAPIASPVLEKRGRRRARDNNNDESAGESLQGHRCPAGCGHFCWAAMAEARPDVG
ncbi:WD-REPEATS-REGION domain-containing protein [Mycena indigotica]|uniref:WD-REPEATS-REGION domain-containing protein n=1 Tax=Mycena indigotica TaxID=2126181 RepID=A0A8H6S9K0_9AGAR|nr:WD-REPEATS-REGION domain-containing protein [Mycena indigotica]KAF7294862.1 WD-REPEATS-REGION domain-containing protein [Mycena indigotica]